MGENAESSRRGRERARRARWRSWMLALAALAAWAPEAFGQIVRDNKPIEVEARLSPERAYLGSTTDYRIVVAGTRSADARTPAAPEGIEIRRAGTSVQTAPTLIINGRRQYTGRDKVVLGFEITPTRAGEFEIPATTVTVDGQRYSTNPVTLVVLEPRETQDYPIRVIPSTRRAYVGEPVRVRVRALVPLDAVEQLEAARTRRGRSSMREIHAITGQLAPEHARLVEPSDQSWLRERGDGVYPISFLGQESLARVVEQPDEGAPDAFAFEVERIIVPERPGALELGSIASVFTARDRDDPRGGATRFMARAEPVTIEIEPVPEQGRPPHFTGLVGTGRIEATAEPVEVAVGDPITLTVRIEAAEPISRVDPPDLASQPGFTGMFKLSPDGWELSERAPDAVAYRTTVRARRSSVSELPGVELAYFSPEAGRYEIAASASIPLDVRAMSQVTADDAIVAGGADVADDAGNPLLSAPPGVRANYTDAAALLANESPNPFERLSREAWAGILLVPPGLWLVSVGVGWITTPAMRARRRRITALRRAKRSIARAGDDPARIAAAIRRYAADRTLQPARAFTNEDCVALLADGTGAEAVGTLREVLDACNAAEFGGMSPGGEPLAARARRALDAMTRAGAPASTPASGESA